MNAGRRKPTIPRDDTHKPAWNYPEISVSVDGKRHYAKLTAAPNGQWWMRRRVDGGRKAYYFGRWSNGHDNDELQLAALANWKRRWPFILRGADEPTKANGSTSNVPLLGLATAYIRDVESGGLSPSTVRKYKSQTKTMLDLLGRKRRVGGLTPADFRKLRERAAEKFTPDVLNDFQVRVRAIMAFAEEEFGIRVIVPQRGFRGPSVRAKRQHRKDCGRQLLPWSFVRAAIDAADPYLRPCILLGINAGMTPVDIATLEPGDIVDGVTDYDRVKTGQRRVVVYWPETLDAIEAVAHDGPLLVTERGRPWQHGRTYTLAKRWRELCDNLGAPARFRFGDLRHNTRTIGGEIDRDATRRLLGQSVGDELDERYDHAAMVGRVRAVSERVRLWLHHNKSG